MHKIMDIVAVGLVAGLAFIAFGENTITGVIVGVALLPITIRRALSTTGDEA